MESNFIRRQVVVKPGDWMNSNVGTVPVIYSNDNQENVLPDGLYCDLGHVLAGMDASNGRVRTCKHDTRSTRRLRF